MHFTASDMERQLVQHMAPQPISVLGPPAPHPILTKAIAVPTALGSWLLSPG